MPTTIGQKEELAGDLDEIDRDILEARVMAAIPLTEEFYTPMLPQREKVFNDDFKELEPYKDPTKPSIDHLKNGYLKKLVQKYEQA